MKRMTFAASGGHSRVSATPSSRISEMPLLCRGAFSSAGTAKGGAPRSPTGRISRLRARHPRVRRRPQRNFGPLERLPWAPSPNCRGRTGVSVAPVRDAHRAMRHRCLAPEWIAGRARNGGRTSSQQPPEANASCPVPQPDPDRLRAFEPSWLHSRTKTEANQGAITGCGLSRNQPLTTASSRAGTRTPQCQGTRRR